MELRIIVGLVIVVLILVCAVAWLILDVKTLDKRCHKLESQDLQNKSNIIEIGSKVDLLNDIYNARKELELMVERKEKMSDYIIDHRDESSIDLAGHLYEIAKGRYREDK